MTTTNIIDILFSRAQKTPRKTAFIFLEDGEQQETRLTYHELCLRVQSIAKSLSNYKNETALLLFPSGIDYICGFLGCLYAEVIAVPAYPPQPHRMKRTLPRLKSIIENSRSKIILTNSQHIQTINRVFNDTNIHISNPIAIDTIIIEKDLQNSPQIQADVAFLQYTSGSTGNPRGVMVTHNNIIHNASIEKDIFPKTEQDIGVSWLPMFHDMGLFTGIIHPIFNGYTQILMSPESFVQKPFRWLQAIYRYGGTTSYAPNFAYVMCVKKINAAQKKQISLKTWRIAANAAEPVRQKTMDDFYQAFKECEFSQQALSPAYGMAEATLIVSGGNPKEKYRRAHFLKDYRGQNATTQKQVISGGTPRGEVIIVHPQTMKECNEQHEGEIWIKNASVSPGYWNNSAANTEKFEQYTADTKKGPFFRSGDLGFIKDGELYITGRYKDMIIVRGSNFYPQDIEYVVEESDPSLRSGCGAAFSIEVDDEEHLVILQEINSTEFAYTDIIDKILQQVSSYYEIEVAAIVLIAPQTIPKTSSGKIQRSLCRTLFIEGKLTTLHSWKNPIIQTNSQKSAGEIEQWLIAKLQSWGIDTRIDSHAPFSRYGLGSSRLIELSGELQNWLNCTLNSTVMWEYPTIASLASFLSANNSSALEYRPISREATPTITQQPIAVVGMGCRFPGSNNVDEYWQFLMNGQNAIRKYPQQRFAAKSLSSFSGGFIDDVDQFDPVFWGIAPKEVPFIDPQQRILLEVTWQALESAGIPPKKIRGTDVGIFIGISSWDYSQLHMPLSSTINEHSLTGNALSIAANRISYLLDLHGPSMAIDTACSSSLTAIHIACQNLRNAECSMAIAGGVNVILSGSFHHALQHKNMLSPHFKCQTFSAEADGYVRGEGCGMVVLKRLDDAIRHQDNILAVIRGSAVNQDGQSNGLTAPNPHSQQHVVNRALRFANIRAQDIDYIETHGTGTPLGDPIEINALHEIYQQRNTPCFLGAVKANIGHLEAAAGVAGLIKTVLCIHHRRIPPQMYATNLNPLLQDALTTFTIPQQSEPWKNEKRCAGVSSLGFGGANAHIVLSNSATSSLPSSPREHEVFCVSARDKNALRQLLQKWQAYLQDTTDSLRDICYSANSGRNHFIYRWATTAKSCEDLHHKICDINTESICATQDNAQVSLLFTGQASTAPGMGQDLYENHQVFRTEIDACAQICKQYTDVSLVDLLTNADNDHYLQQDAVCAQLALFSFEVALFSLWQSWGIKPSWVMGHSLGEYAAAYVAGVFSLEDALKIIAVRAQLMKDLKDCGTMVAIEKPHEKITINEHISIAAINGPQNTVLSGSEQHLRDYLAHHPQLPYKWLQVTHGFHSPILDSILDSFEQQIAAITYHAPQINIVSNVTGQSATQMDASYWRKHLRETVRFSDGVQFLRQQGTNIFLEIGPRPVLSALVKKSIPHALSLYYHHKNSWRTLASTLRHLYRHGLHLQWSNIYRAHENNLVPIPHYSFHHSSYWLKSIGDSSTESVDSYSKMLGMIEQQNALIRDIHQSVSVKRDLRDVGGDLRDVNIGQDLQDGQDKYTLLIGAISEVSGFPVDEIYENDHFMENLGFDSLMIVNLQNKIMSLTPFKNIKIKDLATATTVGILYKQLTNDNPTPQKILVAKQNVSHEDSDFKNWPEYKSLQKSPFFPQGENPYRRIHESQHGITTTVNGKEVINFASYDYLSLTGESEIINDVQQTVALYGTSASASPLLMGDTPIHRQLENEIASFIGTHDAMVFPSGHATNVTAVGHLFSTEDLIIHDQLIHNSVAQGAILSGAKYRSFPHNDWQMLDKILTTIRHQYRRVLIAIEGVYSQDGDIAPLPQILEVKRKHRAWLLVDEAHSMGTLGKTGRGISEYFAIDPLEVDLWMSSISKALASCGGYLAGQSDLMRYLKFTVPGYIFAATISPANTMAALSAIRTIKKQPRRVAQLQENAALFLRLAKEAGLNTGPSQDSPVIPIILGSIEKCIHISQKLLEQGINVMPIGYPAVPKTQARLRFFVNTNHSTQQIQKTIEILIKLGEEYG
ncbi:type I polyketide synthase [Candidatus Uabimicrobium amorphum]|uniref:Polyketide synthase n=1 Tax=Uabimicrobium amorphum TaxID=2596890 RepID=A0A5S9II62_UABAM|nr:type I polyketide synthase [Candidatus Uabimicrobium amorphum]BBM82279.1 polyketide synthase [Candidatus Uabimicrobium amorphum]